MKFLESLGITAGALTSVIVFGFTFYKLFLKKWLKKRKEERQKQWDTITLDIKLIKQQVFPNGGESIVDMQRNLLIQVKDAVYSINTLAVGQRNMLDIMDVASWESDSDGKTVYVNKTYCELVRCIPVDALGNSWIGLVATFDRDRVMREWNRSIENASDFDLCYCFQLPDGSYQRVNGVAIHNKDKSTGKLQSSIGRLIKIGEPTFDIEKAKGNSSKVTA